LQWRAQAWRDIPAAARSLQTSSVGDSGSNNNIDRSLASSLQCPYKQWDCALGRLTKPLSCIHHLAHDDFMSHKFYGGLSS
jgi:hypothetical protein